MGISLKMNKFGENWDTATENLIIDNLQEICSEDFNTERNMRKNVNL